MSQITRSAFTTAAVALAALAATPAAAQVGPDRNATATARIMRPLTLTWVDDLDLGTIVLSGTGTWSGAVISVSQTGVLSCTNTNVTCSGAYKQARYRVTGTNNQSVTVTAPNVELTNQDDPTQKLWLTTSAPSTVPLGASGNAGVEFGVGGSITVSSSTADGTYLGTFNVTVNY